MRGRWRGIRWRWGRQRSDWRWRIGQRQLGRWWHRRWWRWRRWGRRRGEFLPAVVHAQEEREHRDAQELEGAAGQHAPAEEAVEEVKRRLLRVDVVVCVCVGADRLTEVTELVVAMGEGGDGSVGGDGGGDGLAGSSASGCRCCLCVFVGADRLTDGTD